MEGVTDFGDESSVPGSLVGMLRRSEPGLAKGLLLRACVGGTNRKSNLLFEGVGHSSATLRVPELRSGTRGV